MEIVIQIVKFYKYRNWFFYFKKYKNIKGIIIMICGVHIRITEINALRKLIAIARANAIKKTILT